jgi:hypothetical protein
MVKAWIGGKDGVVLLTNEFKHSVNKRKGCTYHKNELYFLCPTPMSCSRMEIVSLHSTLITKIWNSKSYLLHKSHTHIYNPKISSPIEITTIAILSSNVL